MILPDVNLLVYAVDRDSRYHASARQWLDQLVAGTESIGLAWNVVLGFVRITTGGILSSSLTADQAFEVLAIWLALPRVRLIEPGPGHFDLLRSLLRDAGTAGNLTSDAHLAAIAIEHNAEVCSVDVDFKRFAGVRWRNPLAT